MFINYSLLCKTNLAKTKIFITIRANRRSCTKWQAKHVATINLPQYFTFRSCNSTKESKMFSQALNG
jgi:hypothetical protein